MSPLLPLLMVAVQMVPLSWCYQVYQTNIPNGANVPNPCQPGTNATWPGVGHKLVGGTGDRNPFGLAFAANGKTWNAALCNADSDGDGLTNGQELGDPSCTWTQGQTPSRTTGLSHPGVCEPMSSTACQTQNAWLECPVSFNCPALRLNTTRSLTITVPRTQIPAVETTYICYGMRFPNDTAYQLIGMTPVISNSAMLHHMLLYGCTSQPNALFMNGPQLCSMGIQGCQTLIGLWGVGSGGQCHADAFGFPIGQGGFQYAIMQLHWNNALLQTNQYDASGMTLYYTSVLRPNAGAIVMVGQMDLTIPPLTPSVSFSGGCTKACTGLMQPQSVNIAAAILHMHLLGKSGDIQLVGSKTTQKLVVEASYDYNAPTITTFAMPVVFNAGDEIRVNCVYQSLSRNTTTYWGEGTQDEMCFGFITIYPAPKNFDYCSTWRDVNLCAVSDSATYNNCDRVSFTALIPAVGQVCSNCSATCQALICSLRSTGCLDGNMGQWIRKYWTMGQPQLKPLFSMIDACGPAAAPGSATKPCTTGGCGAPQPVNAILNGAPRGMGPTGGGVVLAAVVALAWGPWGALLGARAASRP